MSQDNNDTSYLPEWASDIESSIPEGTGRITLEFPDNSTPLTVSRREFLRVASVAAATAGVAACRQEKETIEPYANRPENVYHDKPGQFSTVCGGCSAQCGAVMEVREGRPIKVDGNVHHPTSKGTLCARGQATIFDLYSADRVKSPAKIDRNGKATDLAWDAFDAEVSGALKGAKAVRVLTGGVTGPGTLDSITKFLGGFGDGKHVLWEPTAPSANRAANKLVYGDPAPPVHRLDRAEALVSVGADFLAWGSEYERGWAQRRNADRAMSKLHVFEARLSTTGAMADVRTPLHPNFVPDVALAIAHELVVALKVGPLANDSAVAGVLAPFAANKVATAAGINVKFIKDAAASLKKSGRKGLMLVGGAGDSVAAQVAGHIVNETLSAGGTTVDWKTRSFHTGVDFDVTAARSSAGGYAALRGLVDELNAGKVDVLLIAGINPVYDSAPGLKFTEALGKAKKIVYVGDLLNETAAKSDLLAAGTHWMEAWGDSQSRTGVYSLSQPGVEPAAVKDPTGTKSFRTVRSLVDCMVAWGADPAFAAAKKAQAAYKGTINQVAPSAGYYFIRSHWETVQFAKVKSPLGFSAFWDALLRRGVWFDRSAKPANASANFGGALGKFPKGTSKGGNAVVVFPSLIMGDGRQAHNGLLHETPDPITQATWGDYAGVAPKKFKALGLTKVGQVVELKAGTTTIKIPVVIMPGLPETVVALPLGYGRTHAGLVGSDIGVNAYQLTEVKEDGISFTAAADIKPTGEFDELGIQRGKGSIVDLHARHLLPFATLADYKKNPNAGAVSHNDFKIDKDGNLKDPGLWSPHAYEARKFKLEQARKNGDLTAHDFKWGMTIDLSRCSGCSACVTACYVENNIPVVGKQGIQEGRTMAWMRIDRYYMLPPKEDHGNWRQEQMAYSPEVAAADHLENPTVLIQPMLCQHCDNAPCETVCPVLATVHSTDGINEQIYNRCVGTRYCANNCPYKVRRYNWYNYADDRSEEFFADFFAEMKVHGKLNARWPSHLRFNPEVTVRTRGVMEKCSLCIQRIRKGSNTYRRLGIDEPVQTACQQTCPSGAIEFGNVFDEKSPIRKNYDSPRTFKVLEHLNTQPGVRYMTRIHNA